jgi:hypothetical protein
MGHYCRICGCTRPNEKFSGRGHRQHICKECQCLPARERILIEEMQELWGFLDQKNISARNIGRLKTLVADPDPEVQGLATLILDVALVHPRKRRRWRNLAARHKALFLRAVEMLGPDFFYDVLTDYGDTRGPLWNLVMQSRNSLPPEASCCACGSGLPFRDCCLERENRYADEAAGGEKAAASEAQGASNLMLD